MSSTRLLLWPGTVSTQLRPCYACWQGRRARDCLAVSGPLRLAQRLRQTGTQTRQYAAQRIDYARMRKDADDRARKGFFTQAAQQKALLIKADTAYAIYAEFAHRNKSDPKANVLAMSKKYDVDLESLTTLALVTFKIPDFSDPVKRATLPPSQHKIIAGQILQGCAYNADPLAIVHILTAWVTAEATVDEGARSVASLFSRKDIIAWFKILDDLCHNAQKLPLGPDLLTVKGIQLDYHGHTKQAQAVLAEAVERSTLAYSPGSRHPMQFPTVPPWNVLGSILQRSKNPEDRALAATYFELGAKQADDPNSCYEFARLSPPTSLTYFEYMSKAAASGHQDAIHNIAAFYRRLLHDPSILEKDAELKKSLNWVLGWKGQKALQDLTLEWMNLAAGTGTGLESAVSGRAR